MDDDENMDSIAKLGVIAQHCVDVSFEVQGPLQKQRGGGWPDHSPSESFRPPQYGQYSHN